MLKNLLNKYWKNCYYIYFNKKNPPFILKLRNFWHKNHLYRDFIFLEISKSQIEENSTQYIFCILNFSLELTI